MGRILGWLLVAMAAILFLRTQKKAQRVAQKQAPPVDNMARCVHCNVHVPQAEGVSANGRFYCCEEHRALDQT